jgi:hypothetical protein
MPIFALLRAISKPVLKVIKEDVKTFRAYEEFGPLQ